MDSRHDLVDVLLLSDCNIYDRYPELVQRVDYFLYEWTEEMLVRTEALLRRQSRGLRNSEATKERIYNTGTEEEAYYHVRSLNVTWRQFAVNRLQLPMYPPERINWNKDADPVFLYGQMPALRLEVPWSIHISMRRAIARKSSSSSLSTGKQKSVLSPMTATAVGINSSSNDDDGMQPHLPLKPALKRTDLQTYLTSPTLSPASSPPHSPTFSPAISIRENKSTSSLESDGTLESDHIASMLKPRLRFNDKVEQCMVVFKQEKEYLPTDYEDNDEDEDDGYSVGDGKPPKIVHFAAKNSRQQQYCRHHHHYHQKQQQHRRRTVVIKLAPTHLNDNKLSLKKTSAATKQQQLTAGDRYQEFTYEDDYYYDNDDDDFFGDSLALFGSSSSQSDDFSSEERTINRYIGGSNSSSAGGGMGGYVQGYVQSVAGQVRKFVGSSSNNREEEPSSAYYVSDPFATNYRHTSNGNNNSNSNSNKTSATSSATAVNDGVVRDPFASVPTTQHPTISADRPLFDDDGDEDVIIQEFEREIESYNRHVNGNTSAIHNAACDVQSPRLLPAVGMELDEEEAALLREQQQQQQQIRNGSLIDRAEDTIFNTVDAVKWCASFISNYTIF